MAGPVLRTRPQRRPDAGVVALVLSLAIAIAAPVLLGSGLALSMATQIAWLAIVLLANNLLLGRCGLLSFGHALQVGAGALAGVAAMRWGAAGGAMPLPLVPLVGGLAALALSVPLGFVATRAAGTAFAMVTLALGELAAAAALMLPDWFGGEAGLTADRAYGRWWGLDFGAPLQVYGLVVVHALVCGWLLHALGDTALGRLLAAVRDNPARAAFLGHDPRRLRWLAYAIAGFFAGIGGALGAVQFEIVSTAEAVGLARSGSYLLFTYLGGTAQFLGPVLGSVLMVLSTTWLSLWTPAWPLYLGAVFLLTVMYAPTGLAGCLAAAPAAVRRHGWPRCLAALVGGSLLGAGGVALVELGYRWRWHGDAPAWLGHAVDLHAAPVWMAAVATAAVGAVLLAAAFRGAGR